jgi:thioredoxin 1
MSIHPKTAEEFVTLVKSSNLCFVKWGASWCGPCRTIQPFFDKYATANKDKAKFIVIEADQTEFEPLAAEYKISALPTFHVFVNQKLVKSITGANPKALETMINEFVSV